MDRRRVKTRGPVSDAHIEGPALSGLVHQSGDIRYAGILSGSRDPNDDGRRQVECSGKRHIPFASRLRFAFAGHQRAVEAA